MVGETPGSFWQVQTKLQLITNLTGLGMPVQAAVDAPRWTMGGQTMWTDSSRIEDGMVTGAGDPQPETSSVIGY